MGDHVIVRKVERADPSVIEALGAAGVATVYESQGKQGLLGPEIRPIQQGVRIGGSAVTVESAPGDNLMVHAAVETLRDGDVLVVALTAPGLHGMVGDLLAASFMAHGCVGLVIESGVRDRRELIEMGFPVWSRGVYAAGTAKAAPGSVNLPVTVTGVTVNPGDVIVADDDGVVVVEHGAAAAVLDATRDRIEKEIHTRARLEDGELGVDFYGLRETLGELGVEYRDD